MSKTPAKTQKLRTPGSTHTRITSDVAIRVVKDGRTGALRLADAGDPEARPIRKVHISPGIDLALLGKVNPEISDRVVVRRMKKH